jgi:methionyl-tRNA synthetase
LRYGPSIDDADFTWERFEKAYNNELANELGNALNRIVSMINRYLDGVVGAIPEAGHDNGEYHKAVAGCRFDIALGEVWEQVRGINQYIDEQKPWDIAKSDDSEHLREVLAYSVACLLEIADLLLPLLPQTAAKMIDMLHDGIIKESLAKETLFPKIYNHTEAPVRA